MLKKFTDQVKQHKAKGLTIVHHDKYVCEFPINHRFCMRKFHAVLRHLRTDQIISMNQVLQPEHISAELCELVHTQDYIYRFYNGLTTKDEQKKSGFEWTPGILSRCRYEAGGTLLACQAAVERGLACSTGGGTHHAFDSYGSGYCLLNDMAISATAMIDSKLVSKILIVDLDVHQGDGTASILSARPDIFTLSIHCESNFPFVKQKSDLDIGLKDHTQDAEYLTVLKDCLPSVVDTFRPDLVIYDAGVDPHVEDELGRLDLTDLGLFDRDGFVLNLMAKKGVPAAAVIGGGYSKDLEILGKRHTIVHRAASKIWLEQFV
ncbi:hypothetical protein Btru_015044 [Bulinus truncatus]|nr:hypothetical protein Btru_015044 [Bulinus truncatus]